MPDTATDVTIVNTRIFERREDKSQGPLRNEFLPSRLQGRRAYPDNR